MVSVQSGTKNPTPDSVEVAAISENTRSSALRVLIVDDNHDNADCCSLLFQRSGLEVRAAYSGPEALVIAEKFRPQAVLLDIGMPGMSGYEVARQIRAADWGAHTVLIAVSGWSNDSDKLQAEEAGFNHHVTKPIQFDSLKNLLQGAAGNS
jgi:CheY-like chemotaxis protein